MAAVYNHDISGDNISTNQSALPPKTETPIPPSCMGITVDYDVISATLCGVIFVFGLLYCFLGYRFFKATMFLTGFLFGSTVTYLICLEENLLPPEGKMGIAVLAGILCGLITMLVQYVGLFMTGFCLGVFLGVAGLLITGFFYTPSTLWLPIGVLFLTGIVFALAILYFQKGLTIFGTSLLGAALITAAIDYYLDLFTVVYYVFDVIRLMDTPVFCWYNWVLLASWPSLFALGSIIQWRVTGRHIDHRDAVKVTRQQRKVHLQKIRERDARRDTPGARQDNPTYTDSHPHSRYRHLYQVRRSNGDVISQNFLQGIQNRLSTAVRKKVIANPHPQLSPRDQTGIDIDQSQTALTQTQVSDSADA